MKWNIAAEAISFVMLGIIWVYSRKGSHLPTLKNRIFQGFLLVTAGAILTNILSTIMIYRLDEFPMWMTWSVTMVYYVLTPLMGFAYFLYTVSIVYTERKELRKVIGFGVMPALVYGVLVLINPLTKNLFDISLVQGYVRGPWIVSTYLIFYAYCAASIVVTVLNKKRIDRNIYHILAAFPILAVLVILVQQMYPNVILSGSAATCALLIIYLHLQNKQISMDYLTNVPNRKELLNMLGLMIKKSPEKQFVLVVVSLRDFRQVNNTCGQQKGDEFLKNVCDFLYEIGPKNHVYRFSGDEFALLFTHSDETEIKKCITDIRQRMEKPWQIGDYRFLLSVVMGIIWHSGDGETLEEVINAVEYAVFRAKSGKSGEICYCDKEMLDGLERRRKVIMILKEKIADRSFEMYYQPIYSVADGEFCYAESLMRIPESPIGPIYPSEFIPIAEETGLIIDITYIMLDKVCRFISRLLQRGIPIQAIHVNFSAVQFSQNDLMEKVLEIIRRNHTPMSAIKIEFTESTLAENTQVVSKFAVEMEKHGIKMGLDDFGTGYSNIATVINIPFGTVKLDKSLVWGSVENKKSALTVKNLSRTFQELGMTVIAEGVETEEQSRLIANFGIDQIQGFYYAKPMPEDQLEMFMIKHWTPAD